MGLSIAVDRASFATEVLAKSHEKPVLIDFFAQWCGPCQLLKPVLEKLAQEYDFVLAKIDIDQNPELAQEYSVQGVPDVRIVLNGVVNDGFVGAVPETQLRELMGQLALKSEVDAMLTQIYDEGAIGNLDKAQDLLKTLLAQNPNNYGVTLEAANFYLEINDIATAESILSTIPDSQKDYAYQRDRLKALIFFKRITQESSSPDSPPESSPTNELDQLFQQAAAAVFAEQYQPALAALLVLIRKDRKYRQDGARKAMLQLFIWLGDDHALTKEYRKKLVSALY